MADNLATTQFDLVTNLLNNIPPGYTDETIKKPNGAFDTPKDQQWLRLTTNMADKENVSAGGEYKRQFGIFTIDIFYPIGKGELSALNDAKIISDLYENQNIGNAKCLAVSTNLIGVDGAWYRVQVDVEFYQEGF